MTAIAVPDLNKQFELTSDQFMAWVNHLDSADLAEFTLILGGDDYLLRFVCALDYLTLQKVQFAHPDDMFTMAYWIAAVFFEPELDPTSPTLRNRALRAWKSDAVQSLYDRVRYRSVRQGSIRMQNKLFTIGNDIAEAAMGTDAPFALKTEAAEVLIKIVKLVDQQEQAVRAERTKKGLQAAREALEAKSDLSEREVAVLLKAVKSQLGPEKLRALIASVDPDGYTESTSS